MSVDDFIADPWRQLHESYTESFLHMKPAPEYANGEVILASLYRNVGFANAASQVAEAKVPSNGAKLDKLIERGNPTAISPAGVPASTWKGILAALRSPRQPNQSARRVLQISPIVPDAAIYSLSARLRGNPWNPGEMVRRLIIMGVADHQKAIDLWAALHHAMTVQNNDDLWARFLTAELQAWRPADLTANWDDRQPVSVGDNHSVLQHWRLSPASIPATRFCGDLESVLRLKQILTRRQWISALESLLRIACASHVLWLCKANNVVLKIVEESLQGRPPSSSSTVSSQLERATITWSYGHLAQPKILDRARVFVRSRLRLNLILWQLSEHLGNQSGVDLSNVDAIFASCQRLASEAQHFDWSRYERDGLAVVEQDPRKGSCNNGIGKNIVEFLMHVLRQRPTSEVGMENYDQGFMLRKKGSYDKAPWILSLGPVAVLTLVHCCTSSTRGPRTVEDLCHHLAQYGVMLSPQDIAGSDLGKTLRNLGMVLDSPDAEGGMVLVSPFQSRLEGQA